MKQDPNLRCLVTLGHSSALLTYCALRSAVTVRLAVPSLVYTQPATERFRLPPRRSGTVWHRILCLPLYLQLPTEDFFVQRFLFWCDVVNVFLWFVTCTSQIQNVSRHTMITLIIVFFPYYQCLLNAAFKNWGTTTETWSWNQIII